MTDVLVVGGGIAGIAAAAALAETLNVTLVEQESMLAYHSTGRSAAVLFENYGAAGVRPLTRWSRRFLAAPPDGFHRPLMRERGGLYVGGAEQMATLRAIHSDGVDAGTRVEFLDGPAVVGMVPVLRPDSVAGGVWEPGVVDLDVAAIHQGFTRRFRSLGGSILTAARCDRLVFHNRIWKASCGDTTIETDTVVNAAGAWGDVVAAAAGVAPLGLTPKRRTAFMTEAPEGAARWPLVAAADHGWYFKPDGTQLLCSPADETPTGPMDARPHEIDVALAIERINTATTLAIRHVRSQWAGLRTFTPDGEMAIGPAPDADGFFWLVGQGGTGIQTAPAAGRLVADLVADGAAGSDLADVDLAVVDPARFVS